MPANTKPIHPLAPATSWATSAITTGNAGYDGTGTVGEVFTAGANGARISQVVIKPRGTNVACVVRLYVNNGGSNAVASNNSLIDEVAFAASTASTTAALPRAVLEINAVLKPAHKLIYSVSTGVASGFSVTAKDAGDY